jgi:hypothetical protein
MNLQKVLKSVADTYVDQSNFTLKEFDAVASKLGYGKYAVANQFRKFPKVSRGIYNLEAALIPFRSINTESSSTVVQNVGVSSVSNDEVYIPEKDDTFVEWGNFRDILKIVKSYEFYPTYVTGLSGNGKTFMIEQACAKAGREYVRVQISPETDEDDLIGGFRLIQGETVFQKGPVIKAMEQGALLLIDEIDRGTNKIMALQGVLEGKPILIKKTGEVIKPAKGFNVISTANTKGKGSDDGRYTAATIIDEAFLERFTITVEQKYPSASIEKKILLKHMEKFNCVDDEFANLLVGWADTIRKTFEDEGIDEVISTRRLCHIIQTFSIFGKRDKAVELCVNRFDDDTKESFIDLYSKVDATVTYGEEELVESLVAEDVQVPYAEYKL